MELAAGCDWIHLFLIVETIIFNGDSDKEIVINVDWFHMGAIASIHHIGSSLYLLETCN